MIRRPPRSTPKTSSAASDVYKRQVCRWLINKTGISELLMVARQQEPLALLQKELDGGTITSLDEALPQADIVVWVASMPKTIEINTDNLKKPVSYTHLTLPTRS